MAFYPPKRLTAANATLAATRTDVYVSPSIKTEIGWIWLTNTSTSPVTIYFYGASAVLRDAVTLPGLGSMSYDFRGCPLCLAGGESISMYSTQAGVGVAGIVNVEVEGREDIA